MWLNLSKFLHTRAAPTQCLSLCLASLWWYRLSASTTMSSIGAYITRQWARPYCTAHQANESLCMTYHDSSTWDTLHPCHGAKSGYKSWAHLPDATGHIIRVSSKVNISYYNSTDLRPSVSQLIRHTKRHRWNGKAQSKYKKISQLKFLWKCFPPEGTDF